MLARGVQNLSSHRFHPAGSSLIIEFLFVKRIYEFVFFKFLVFQIRKASACTCTCTGGLCLDFPCREARILDAGRFDHQKLT
jgi:hypothetical protein